MKRPFKNSRPVGPFVGFESSESRQPELMIRFKDAISQEDEDEVIEELRQITRSLSSLSTPVSGVLGPNNDAAVVRWTDKRVTETDLKSIRKTMNGVRGFSTVEVDELSVVINK